MLEIKLLINLITSELYNFMILFYCIYLITCYVLSSRKSSIRIFQKMMQKHLNKIFGKPSMYVVCLVTQSSAALCNPMVYSPPGSSLSMGFSRQEDWSRLPFPSPGALSGPRFEPTSPALQANSLPAEP